MRNLSDVIFHLCDLNADLIDQWKLYFGDHSNFTFHHGDIFKVYEDLKSSNENIGLVSPANSFDWIDLSAWLSTRKNISEEKFSTN